MEIDAPHRGWTEMGHAVLQRLEGAGRGDDAAGGDDATSDAGRARERFRCSLSATTPFSIIAANAGLDPLAAEVLAVLCVAEMEPTRSRLTLGDLARLWPDEPVALRAVAPESALVGAALVRVATEGRWAARAVSVVPTVCWALVGDPSRDPDLPIDARILDARTCDARLPDARLPDAGLPAKPPKRAVSAEPARSAEPAHPAVPVRRLLVVGRDRQRRLEAALERACGVRFLSAGVPGDEPGWAALVREATLRGAGLVVDLDQPLDATARRWLRAAGHLTWVLSSPLELPLDALPDDDWVEVTAADAPVADAECEDLLGGSHPGLFGIGAEQLRLVGRAAPMLGGDVAAALRRLASGEIDRLARRIRPHRGWDDLVVPNQRRALLGDIALRYRHRDTVLGQWGHRGRKGAGVVALFHGPSGTGKTLSAEIVAHELGLDLFAIDLAAVVSKYIGETEKNLEAIFQAAAAGRVVLLFDEADAIFGERSKTNDAHDRYANLEVSYLLQRIEAYDGVAILTTNLMNNIDHAFLRRVDVAVEFTLPDEAERRALWAGGFPPRAPQADLDIDLLARQFRLPGAAIHNVALTAAFLAAEAGSEITMGLVVAALDREYAKLGRLRTPEEFGSLAALLP
ncbi:MAG: ATP-binding protein [Acidimicrobiales bacterium]